MTGIRSLLGNLLTLRFEPDMEQQFTEYYFQNTVRKYRVGIFIGFILYELFYILDLLSMPDLKASFALIRFGIVGPLILILFFLSRTTIYIKLNQQMNAGGILAAGGGIIAMTLSKPEYTSNYYAGLILVLIYCYALMGIRFAWASFAGGVLVVSYILGIEIFTELAFDISISNYFFLVSANMLLMLGAFISEKMKRQEFLLQHQLQKEQKRIADINIELESIVQERTADLKKEIQQRIGDHAKIQKALDEREVLLKEVYHRTKNNMNVVISLLNMQAREKSERPVKEVFKRISDRIYSMSLVHEQLYKSSDLTRIQLNDYIEKLVRQLKYSLMEKQEKIHIEFNMKPIKMDLETAVPLGLALNELLTNTITHGFPGDREGKIHFSMGNNADEEIIIEILNDGVPLPEKDIMFNSNTMGLKLVHMLVEDQLNGSIDMMNDPEPRIKIVLPG